MAQLMLTPVNPEARRKNTKVPLDLVTALPDRGRFDALVVRVGDLPYGASLTNGRNNGDRSWTVTVNELNGLSYIPSRPDFTNHSLSCRVIGIVDNEEAVVLEEFDLAISTDGRTPEIPKSEKPSKKNTLVNISRIKAWAEGSNWANEASAAAAAAARTDSELEVLQAIFEDRFAELTQRLKEAESQISALKRVAREAHAKLSVVEANTTETAMPYRPRDVTELSRPASIVKVSSVA